MGLMAPLSPGFTLDYVTSLFQVPLSLTLNVHTLQGLFFLICKLSKMLTTSATI